jgi:hypothetical protein
VVTVRAQQSARSARRRRETKAPSIKAPRVNPKLNRNNLSRIRKLTRDEGWPEWVNRVARNFTQAISPTSPFSPWIHFCIATISCCTSLTSLVAGLYADLLMSFGEPPFLFCEHSSISLMLRVTRFRLSPNSIALIGKPSLNGVRLASHFPVNIGVVTCRIGKLAPKNKKRLVV